MCSARSVVVLAWYGYAMMVGMVFSSGALTVDRKSKKMTASAVALVASLWVALTASGSIEIEQKDSVRSPYHADSLVELCRLGHNH